MRHPLQTTLAGNQSWIFWPLLCLTLVVMAVLNWVDLPLKNAVAKNGMVSFELAGDAAHAQGVLESWDDRARRVAAFSLGFDYLFLCCYSTSIAFGCVWAASILQKRFGLLGLCGIVIAWGQWLAAIFDGTENLSLLMQLFHRPNATWAQLAWWCATLKFGIASVGLVYVLLGLVAYPFRRS